MAASGPTAPTRSEARPRRTVVRPRVGSGGGERRKPTRSGAAQRGRTSPTRNPSLVPNRAEREPASQTGHLAYPNAPFVPIGLVLTNAGLTLVHRTRAVHESQHRIGGCGARPDGRRPAAAGRTGFGYRPSAARPARPGRRGRSVIEPPLTYDGPAAPMKRRVPRSRGHGLRLIAERRRALSIPQLRRRWPTRFKL